MVLQKYATSENSLTFYVSTLRVTAASKIATFRNKLIMFQICLQSLTKIF